MHRTQPTIIPNLWFDGNIEEAVAYYLSIFKDGKVLKTTFYPKTEAEGLAPFQKELAGKVLTIEFEILGMRFIGINAGPEFKFNESVSFMIPCKDQKEIDYYWDALTANGGEESVCGWLKDKFGLSWQICPADWEALLNKPGGFQKMMEMKKIIISAF